MPFGVKLTFFSRPIGQLDTVTLSSHWLAFVVYQFYLDPCLRLCRSRGWRRRGRRRRTLFLLANCPMNYAGHSQTDKEATSKCIFKLPDNFLISTEIKSCSNGPAISAFIHFSYESLRLSV